MKQLVTERENFAAHLPLNRSFSPPHLTNMNISTSRTQQNSIVVFLISGHARTAKSKMLQSHTHGRATKISHVNIGMRSTSDPTLV
ncbi:hypothetical protein L596_006229 [Steinernema carpocapsae]|uniref:Uncharacterized protein n=1 Tax=Steinernema carpocapsae TaxID=34508 RepID=A0A4U8V956_STECR|nr:hypothetical protein L596_006229 [Steinernema carpocapsae]